MSINNLASHMIRRFATFLRPSPLLAALWLAVGAPAQADDWVYTARAGDTLFDLAGAYTKRQDYWQKMQVLNRIADPRKIPPGTKIRIPLDWLRLEPVPARVAQTHGDCLVFAAGGSAPQAARQGMELRGGDAVRTGLEASMSLEFADGSKLLVRPQSRLVLDSLSVFRAGAMVDTRLRLEQGAVDSQVAPAPAGAGPRFRITTPSAVAAVRGTDFRVGTEPGSGAVMRNETLGGTVEVAGSHGHRLVPTGFGLVAKANQPPPATRKLLPPPELTGLPPVVERLPIAFTWPQEQGAVAYRAQIAADAHFEALLADRKVDAANAELGVLPDGDYRLRVRGIDADGLEGYDAAHSFTLNARPEPPFAISPEEGGELVTARPKFAWAIPEGAARYHLQISASSDFALPMRDFPSIADNSLELDQDLPPGQYFWRIAAIDAQGDHGPYSEVHAFSILPPASRQPAKSP